MTHAVDFSVLSDEDPYTLPNFSSIDGGGLEIANGELLPLVRTALQRFRFDGMPNSTIAIDVTIDQNNLYYFVGGLAIDATGAGYVLRISYGRFVAVGTIDAAGTIVWLPAGDLEDTTFTVSRTYRLQVNTATGDIDIYRIGEPLPLVSVNDTTHSTGLAEGLYLNVEPAASPVGIAGYSANGVIGGSMPPILTLTKQMMGN